MMDSIYLMGSEDVRSAANTMSQAAQEMNRAGNNMADVFAQHQRFMEDWLQRAEAALQATKGDGQ